MSCYICNDCGMQKDSDFHGLTFVKEQEICDDCCLEGGEGLCTVED